MTHHDKNVLTWRETGQYEGEEHRTPTLCTREGNGGRCLNLPWFVVQTHHRQEHVAARELADNDYPHYLPMQAVQRRDKGALVTKHVPMFSQYLFVQVPPGMSAAHVRYLPGVRDLFSTPQLKPIAVPGGFVERLINEAPARLKLSVEALPCLAKGVPVRATEGPLTGLTGVVIACDGLMTTADMMLFGTGRCPVEMRRCDLKVLATPAS